MTDLLTRTRSLNQLGETSVAEPFAGGAGASLSMLYREDTPEIRINDADVAIHDFWWAVVNRADEFAALVESAQLDIEEWIRQRDVYRSGDATRLDRGFACFYLNRCNRSGVIINGGPIGGFAQKSEWGIDARFNKRALVERCRRVSEYADRISVTKSDGLDFIRSLDARRTFFFVDPPYYHKGSSLYLNAAGSTYHQDLATLLRSMNDAAWVLTYDDCPEIRTMYEDWASIHPFALRYVANSRREGREILITPKWMVLPSTQASGSISW